MLIMSDKCVVFPFTDDVCAKTWGVEAYRGIEAFKKGSYRFGAQHYVVGFFFSAKSYGNRMEQVA